VSVTVRRLHDIDRSGWWAILSLWNYLFVIQGSTKASMSTVFSQFPHGVAFALVLSFIAVVVILFVFTITRGTEGLNRYGPDPYGPNQLEEVFA
jgi:uncharacterized membrane protein YhaH (DUF805 family)